jgi:hypothetical protein
VHDNLYDVDLTISRADWNGAAKEWRWSAARAKRVMDLYDVVVKNDFHRETTDYALRALLSDPERFFAPIEARPPPVDIKPRGRKGDPIKVAASGLSLTLGLAVFLLSLFSVSFARPATGVCDLFHFSCSGIDFGNKATHYATVGILLFGGISGLLTSFSQGILAQQLAGLFGFTKSRLVRLIAIVCILGIIFYFESTAAVHALIEYSLWPLIILFVALLFPNRNWIAQMLVRLRAIGHGPDDREKSEDKQELETRKDEGDN